MRRRPSTPPARRGRAGAGSSAEGRSPHPQSASLVVAVDCVARRLHHVGSSGWEPWGSQELACWPLVGELLVHSWDLAPAAVGTSPVEPSACARAAVVACEGLLERYRVPPAGRSDRDRVAALYGRDPVR